MSIMVGRDEASLLTAARAVVGALGRSEIEPLLLARGRAPENLSPRAMELLQTTLARGVVLSLCRGGGARLENQKPLWERQSPPPLQFSQSSFALLQWLVAWPLVEPDVPQLRLSSSPTLADELLLLGALTAAMGTPAERTVAKQEAIRSSALCWLAVPAVLARAEERDAPPTPIPSLQVAALGRHHFAVSALQGSLTRWWSYCLKQVARTSEPEDVARMGEAQGRVLTAALTATEGQRQLMTFLLDAVAPVLDAGQSEQWVSTFDERQALRLRTAARAATGRVLETVAHLHQWDTEARAVRFIDDGYEQSQALVKTWERCFGDARFRKASAVREQLNALL